MNVLVIAPHPDDEVLGCGGTIHRLAAEGHAVTVAIATIGWPPLFEADQVEQVRAEATAAADLLGHHLRFLDLPVTRLHALPEHELNGVFDTLVADIEPTEVYLPHPGDRHEDHRQVFDAALVALRPVASRAYVHRILCYETVSETHWTAPGLEPGFEPQVYSDITDHLEAKLQAVNCYASQVQQAPAARSIQAIRALATFRGSTVGLDAAESFTLVREVRR